MEKVLGISMNVLEIYSSFLPKLGGVERHVYDLCGCLVELGHKPLVFTWMPSKPSFEVIDGISVYRIHIPRLFTHRVCIFRRYLTIFYLSLCLTYIARKYKVQVIHAHDYFPGLVATLTGVFLHIPVFITFHLPIQYTTFSFRHYAPFILIEKILKKLFVLWASAIICVSRFTYKETLKLGFPNSKLKIIYNWVSPSLTKNRWRLTHSAPPKKFKLYEKPYILSVGRLVEKHKAFSKLIYAFKLLRNKGYNLDLVIVGDGPDKDFYQKYISRLRVKDDVHLIGNVSDIDLESLYDGSALFVLPSRFEGFPLVLLEIMSYGKPVVATKVGGIPEVIKNGYNGILTNSDPHAIASGIEKLLLDSSLVKIYSRRSKHIVLKKFSKRNCYETVRFIEKYSHAFFNAHHN